MICWGSAWNEMISTKYKTMSAYVFIYMHIAVMVWLQMVQYMSAITIHWLGAHLQLTWFYPYPWRLQKWLYKQNRNKVLQNPVYILLCICHIWHIYLKWNTITFCQIVIETHCFTVSATDKNLCYLYVWQSLFMYVVSVMRSFIFKLNSAGMSMLELPINSK